LGETLPWRGLIALARHWPSIDFIFARRRQAKEMMLKDAERPRLVFCKARGHDAVGAEGLLAHVLESR